MTGKQARGIAISAWWILVIIVPICTLVLWIALDHTNAAQDRQAKRSNQQFNKALIVTDRKFRQALHSQAVLFSYSINKSTCVLRVIATQQIQRLETTKTTGYRQAEVFWKNILDNQVPIPANFDCSTLPAKPPKALP